jgi:cobalamin biosynthesis protein CobD/CbiB
MGQYTEHWARYTRESTRHTLRLLGTLLLLPVIGLIGYALWPVTRWAFPVVGSLLLLWLVMFTTLALRSTKVPCPRCATIYSRGKYLCNCPKCGLRMLQEDPS